MSKPLSSEELELRQRAISGTATVSDLLRLHAICSERGDSLPLDWEERTLRLALSGEPNRVDLQARLRQVLILQGKEISKELTAAELIAPPPDIFDYQAEMLKYHIRTGMADMDPEFLPIYDKCRGLTMTSAERMYGYTRRWNTLCGLTSRALSWNAGCR